MNDLFFGHLTREGLPLDFLLKTLLPTKKADLYL